MCCKTSPSNSSIVPYDIETIELGQQSHFGCCGLQSYNKLEQECCSGEIIPRSPFHECCSGSYIDTRTHVCCRARYPTREESFPIEGGKKECCGMTPYNRAVQTCSNKILYDIGKNFSETNYLILKRQINRLINLFIVLLTDWLII